MLITATHRKRRQEIEASEAHVTTLIAKHTFLKVAKWVNQICYSKNNYKYIILLSQSFIR